MNNPKSDIFVGRPSTEVKENSFIVSWLLDNLVCWCFGFVNEIRIEDVELDLTVGLLCIGTE
jgi:hypothetical protein